MPPLHEPHGFVAMFLPELLDDPAIDLLRARREIKKLGRAVPKRHKRLTLKGLVRSAPISPRVL